MKNLVSLGIEKLEEIPIQLASHKRSDRRNKKVGGERKWSGKFRYKGKCLYTLPITIIYNNIGKPFDNAFSYFCKQVPKWCQYLFLEDFDKYNHFYIDKDGNIQETYQKKRKTTNISIKSDDYKEELFHKNTGHSIDDFVAVYKERQVWYKPQEVLYYKYYGRYTITPKPLYLTYLADRKDFIFLTTKGWKKEFISKKDPTYIRLRSEQETKKKIKKKELNTEKQEKEYLMLSQQELKNKKEKEQNNSRIEALGFDLKTSFRR